MLVSCWACAQLGALQGHPHPTFPSPLPVPLPALPALSSCPLEGGVDTRLQVWTPCLGSCSYSSSA